jgi:hypothetical protein
MWRLVPLLAGLAFLEVWVPWPEIAALVLSDARPLAAHAVSTHLMLSAEPRQERSSLLVQVGDASP